MGDAIPLPEPAYYQWRRKKMPWSLEFAFSHMCVETTDDSEVRTLHTADQMHAHASAVTAAKDVEIAALRAENDKLKTVMIAAAEEIQAHWNAHCDAEGYGPANLMRRLEEGIPSQYGYTAGAFAALRAEVAQLRADAIDRQNNAVMPLRRRVDVLEDALKTAQYRSMVDARISYRGYSYGMGSTSGITDLRRAIERDGNG